MTVYRRTGCLQTWRILTVIIAHPHYQGIDDPASANQLAGMRSLARTLSGMYLTWTEGKLNILNRIVELTPEFTEGTGAGTSATVEYQDLEIVLNPLGHYLWTQYDTVAVMVPQAPYVNQLAGFTGGPITTQGVRNTCYTVVYMDDTAGIGVARVIHILFHEVCHSLRSHYEDEWPLNEIIDIDNTGEGETLDGEEFPVHMFAGEPTGLSAMGCILTGNARFKSDLSLGGIGDDLWVLGTPRHNSVSG
jgi:hypothetical protein